MINSASPSPVFVLSNWRSGSTLVRYILDTHPDIYCPDEINVGRTCHSLITTMEGLFQSTAGAGSGDKATEIGFNNLEWQRETLIASPTTLARVGKIASGLLQEAASQQQKRIWCDKSPLNLHYVDVLKAVFPAARFICLYRHCLDTVASFLEVNRHGAFRDIVHYFRLRPNNFVEASMLLWLDRAVELLRVEREIPSRCHRITYESVINDPINTIRGMFEFLGLPFDVRMMDSVFSTNHPQRVAHGDVKAIMATEIHRRSMGHRKALPWLKLKALPAELIERVNSCLRSIGYTSLVDINEELERQSGPTTSPAGVSSGGKNDARVIFDSLRKKIPAAPSVQPSPKATARFVLSGGGASEWVVDLSKPQAVIAADEREACYTVRMSTDDLAAVLSGAESFVTVYQERRCQLSGDTNYAPLIQIIKYLIKLHDSR